MAIRPELAGVLDRLNWWNCWPRRVAILVEASALFHCLGKRNWGPVRAMADRERSALSTVRIERRSIRSSVARFCHGVCFWYFLFCLCQFFLRPNYQSVVDATWNRGDCWSTVCFAFVSSTATNRDFAFLGWTSIPVLDSPKVRPLSLIHI